MSQNTPELKKDDGGYIVFGIAIALGLLVMKDVIPLLLFLVGGVGSWRLWKRYQKKQLDKQTHLNEVFYHLVKENEGWITPLDLAMNAQVSAEDVQGFLDQKATEFSAQFEVTDQGGILYYFSTAQAWLESSVNDQMELLETQAENLTSTASQFTEDLNTDSQISQTNPNNSKSVSLFPIPSKIPADIPQNLNQLELAKRLKVHPNTVSRWKTKPQFQEWSFQKDPDQIAWQYSLKTRRFSPVFKSSVPRLEKTGLASDRVLRSKKQSNSQSPFSQFHRDKHFKSS
ncbi:MAG: hypothetical protein AAFO04_14435 [Cyanobacteria bacterium J06592_8]